MGTVPAKNQDTFSFLFSLSLFFFSSSSSLQFGTIRASGLSVAEIYSLINKRYDTLGRKYTVPKIISQHRKTSIESVSRDGFEPAILQCCSGTRLCVTDRYRNRRRMFNVSLSYNPGAWDIPLRASPHSSRLLRNTVVYENIFLKTRLKTSVIQSIFESYRYGNRQGMKTR